MADSHRAPHKPLLGLATAPAAVAAEPSPGLQAAQPALTRVAAPYRLLLGFEQLDVTRGWRFRTDPTDAGLAAGWARPDFDDSGWESLDVGDAWQNLGYPGLDGVGWYRRRVVPPASWQGQPVYLWLNGVNDELDLYVDGQHVAHHGDRSAWKGTWSRKTATRVDGYLKLGQPNVVAIRVSRWIGSGGITRTPAVLSTSGKAPLGGAEYLAELAKLSPDAALPAWARGQDRAWTVAGIPGGRAAAIVGSDGSAAPNAAAFTLTYWVYDSEAKQLIAPEEVPVEQRLQDGYQPTPITTWRQAGLEGESTVLVTDARPPAGLRQQVLRALGLAPGEAEPAMLYRIRLTNPGAAPRKLVVVVALRPYGPEGHLRWLGSVEASGDTVRVNGQLALVADVSPTGFGAASLASRDLSAMVRAGEFPAAGKLVDPQGLATIGLEYPMTVAPGAAQQLVFKLPLTPTAPAMPAFESDPRAVSPDDANRAERLRKLQFDDEARRLRAEWQARLQRVALSLPDQRYVQAFYASLGYMLVNMRGDVVTSGPFAHNAMWYRDAAYVLPALLKAGLSEPVPRVLDRLAAGQMASGEFPAALEVDGRPRFHERHEWDAQGQFVYACAETYRLTRDRARLEAAYPTIVRAVDFAIGLSKAARTLKLEGTPLYGLLPPGDSAEDLGSREWRHYWDDFWTIGGIRQAAELARALRKPEDAARFDREAAELQRLVLQSVERVQREADVDYVPNGPEDTWSTAAARGTTPALWPLKLFARDDPLMRRSFEWYHSHWVEPQYNAYLHNSGNLWVYGGLELAHSQLFLWEAGRAAAMTQWVIDNQTLPGTYAWAEAVSPQSKRFAGGDMPHSWAAAEYVLYLRDALIREDGDRLVLADGLPAPWMAPGQRVEIHRAPTYFGPAGYSLVSHADQGYWELTLDEGTAAPGGFVLRGPFPNAPKRLVVDGRETPPGGTNFVPLPRGFRTVQVWFK